MLFYYKFHKYILARNKIETSGLATINTKKCIIDNDRIKTHSTEIMYKKEIPVLYLLHIRATELRE